MVFICKRASESESESEGEGENRAVLRSSLREYWGSVLVSYVVVRGQNFLDFFLYELIIICISASA